MSDPFDGRPVSPLPPLGESTQGDPVPPVHRPPETAGSGSPESPVALIMVGLFVAVILGGFLIVAGGASDVGVLVLLGYVLAVVGSVITSVGIVAAGVRLGMRWARLDSSR